MIINGTNNNYIYSGINTNIIIYENSSNTSNSVISPSTDIQIFNGSIKNATVTYKNNTPYHIIISIYNFDNLSVYELQSLCNNDNNCIDYVNKYIMNNQPSISSNKSSTVNYLPGKYVFIAEAINAYSNYTITLKDPNSNMTTNIVYNSTAQSITPHGSLTFDAGKDYTIDITIN